MYKYGKTDPSSKYGLNQNQFDKDIAYNLLESAKKKRHFKENILSLINYNTYQEDNFNLIIQCLREIKEKEF
ncbi:hypothetical protein COO16_04015 [Bacillus pseudomycoides]|uniref:hypothetical protein n=1 Tax=Bacillus pseudomycoides TaxID=64104 RepID=UPI000BEB3762|nr:hypothetical protein [Bacillus pseudomycoides]PDY14137.1 hypothetical protein COO16_04015 [Bacillus pseudomycoides]